MVRAAAIGLLGLAACFSPDYPEGVTCEPGGWCPPGQICAVDNRCYREVGDGGAAIPDAKIPDAGLGALVSIDIGPDVTIPVGGTHQFTITGTYENGTQPITDFAIWASSDMAIMFVDFEGVAHGEAPGTATASCDYMGRADTALVTVQ